MILSGYIYISTLSIACLKCQNHCGCNYACPEMSLNLRPTEFSTDAGSKVATCKQAGGKRLGLRADMHWGFVTSVPSGTET